MNLTLEDFIHELFLENSSIVQQMKFTMKLVFIFLLLLNTNVFGQDEVFVDPEEPAEFPGGSVVLKKFIADNLVHPQEAIDNGYQGICRVQFLIGEDGSCKNFIVRNGISDCPNCDKEVLRVLKLMPKWKPGLLDGKPIPMKYILPVSFKLKPN
ncbi:energy transducer TonB [Fluviicola taffensis]|uniref:TonB C-terminal domain-containing protein n=1 Tax=Fluviicola taffensis (strain DSM 16823 / NCIMB 13979 / RW262) TaxID=755732 RepID=F2IC26_FLUTR|nr:energy transducer TonB [Fluviicola taffensis]AEA43252.1 hypothetical protein Fluta_1257 [Fluviicola taffensis DSM 16823]